METIKIRLPYIYQASNGKEIFIHDTDTPLFVGSVVGERESDVVLFHADGRHVYDEKYNLTKELRMGILKKKEE